MIPVPPSLAAQLSRSGSRKVERGFGVRGPPIARPGRRGEAARASAKSKRQRVRASRAPRGDPMQPAPGMPIVLNFVQRLALALVSARLEPWLRERLTASEFEAIRGLLAELLGRPVPPTIGLPAPDPAA